MIRIKRGEDTLASFDYEPEPKKRYKKRKNPEVKSRIVGLPEYNSNNQNNQVDETSNKNIENITHQADKDPKERFPKSNDSEYDYSSKFIKKEDNDNNKNADKEIQSGIDEISAVKEEKNDTSTIDDTINKYEEEYGEIEAGFEKIRKKSINEY